MTNQFRRAPVEAMLEEEIDGHPRVSKIWSDWFLTVAVLDKHGNIQFQDAEANNGYQYVVATNGQSITINNDLTYLILDPAAGIASATITMPANPIDGQKVNIMTSQTITTVTHNPNTGQTLNGALTTLAANSAGEWIYVAQNSKATWFRTV